MKHCIYVIISACLLGCATPMPKQEGGKLNGILPVENEEVVYRQTFEAPGVSRTEAFQRARRWWVVNYKSAKDVLQLADSETGELIGKGITTFKATQEKGQMKLERIVRETITVDTKDNAYTVTMRQFQVLNPVTFSPTPIEKYYVSPERDLRRTFMGLDQHVQETYADIKRAIIEDKQ